MKGACAPVFFLVSVSVGAWVAPVVEARPWRPAQVPNGLVLGCASCHVSPLGGGPRTAFGVEVRTRVTPGGMEEFWSEELAKLDSDGDGTTNGAELQDPGGTWRSGEDDPGDVAAVTNPGVPDGTVPEPEPDPLSPTFHRGDPDNSGATDLTDAILIFNFLFQNGDAPTCAESADFNNDAAIDLTDGVALLNFLFLQGPAAVAPGPVDATCGEDTDEEDTPGDLGCNFYDACGE